MSCTDGAEDPLNDGFDPLMKEEKLLHSPFEDMNTVFKIGFEAGAVHGGILGSEGLAGIDLHVGPVGEEPVESDQNEVGEDLFCLTPRSVLL